MKCYFGGSNSPYAEFSFTSACFAQNAKEAKKLMWNEGVLSDECDGDWLDANVVRKEQYETLIDTTKTEPYIIEDPKTLRLMGWGMEGDIRCDTCGLAEYDGAYPVCEECGQCEECGHSDHD